MSSFQALLRAFILLCILLVAASPVTAFPISQKMSIGELKSTCSKVGGEFLHDAGIMGTCTKKNCDGKGGSCVVSCAEDGTCGGKTPTAEFNGPQTLISILQNGETVLHDSDQGPPRSLSSQSAGFGGMLENVTRDPVPPPLL